MATRRPRAISAELVSPESYYRFAGMRPGTHLRLGYASQTSQEIVAGTNLLLEAITSAQASSSARKR